MEYIVKVKISKAILLLVLMLTIISFFPANLPSPIVRLGLHITGLAAGLKWEELPYWETQVYGESRFRQFSTTFETLYSQRNGVKIAFGTTQIYLKVHPECNSFLTRYNHFYNWWAGARIFAQGRSKNVGNIWENYYGGKITYHGGTGDYQKDVMIPYLRQYRPPIMETVIFAAILAVFFWILAR